MSDNLFNNGHALLIGVGDDLPMTVKDAEAIRDLLIDPERAAYPKDQVALLTNEDANKANIVAELDKLAKIPNVEESTVIIYFSGHGGRVEKDEGLEKDRYYLVAHGCREKPTKESCLKEEEFVEKINQIKSKKLLVILDCCHAAGMTKTKSIKRKEGEIQIKQAVEGIAKRLEGGRGRVIIASCRDDQLSYAGGANSIFTQCLLEVLQGKGHKEDDGEYVNLLATMAYLFKEVPKRTRNLSNGSQNPFIPEIKNLDENFALCHVPTSIKAILKSPISFVDIDATVRERQIQIYEKSISILLRKQEYFEEHYENLPIGPQKFYMDYEILNVKKDIAKNQEKIKALLGKEDNMNL